jgi:hypothetical protein
MIDWTQFQRDVNVPGYIMRPAFLFIRKTLGEDLTGAEIGVYLGETAEYVLNNMRLKKYHMIDPYIPYGDMQRNAEDWDEIHRRILFLFMGRKNVELIRETSEKACSRYQDGCFDFVYIDGNHEYKYVEKDISMWYNKVKDGGILCGHDYQLTDVCNAVNDFAATINTPITTELDWYTKVPDWWFIKNGHR